jgi:predicted negative regulator of RcsB-dependent stress response
VETYDEREQVEEIKQWIREYAPTIVIGLVLGFGLLFGWRYWLQYKHERAVAASQVYEKMIFSLEKNDYKEVVPLAGQLIAQYEMTPYAFNAALMMAKLEVSNGKYEEAEKQLRWAMERSPNSGMDSIVRARLARTLLAQKKHEDALKLVTEFQQAEPSSIYDEIRGDILLGMGKAGEARAAYEEALKDDRMTRERRAMLIMKSNELN